MLSPKWLPLEYRLQYIAPKKSWGCLHKNPLGWKQQTGKFLLFVFPSYFLLYIVSGYWRKEILKCHLSIKMHIFLQRTEIDCVFCVSPIFRSITSPDLYHSNLHFVITNYFRNIKLPEKTEVTASINPFNKLHNLPPLEKQHRATASTE